MTEATSERKWAFYQHGCYAAVTFDPPWGYAGIVQHLRGSTGRLPKLSVVSSVHGTVKRRVATALESPIESCIFVVLFSPAWYQHLTLQLLLLLLYRDGFQERPPQRQEDAIHDQDPQTGDDSTTHLAQPTLKFTVVRFEL